MSLFGLPPRKREDKAKKDHHRHGVDGDLSLPEDRQERFQPEHEAVRYTTEPAFDNGEQKTYPEYDEGGYPAQPAHEHRRHTDKLAHENVRHLDQPTHQPVRYTVAEPAYEDVQEKAYTGTR